MSSFSTSTNLRLVGEPLGQDAERAVAEQVRLAITKENRIAAHVPALAPGFERGIDPGDPRWILAMQAQMRLQGAALRPEQRDELMRKGRNLGLRPFESNLIIAIVQDRARAGLPPEHVAPFLSLVHPPASERQVKPATWPKWVLAIAAAAAVAAAFMRLLLG